MVSIQDALSFRVRCRRCERSVRVIRVREAVGTGSEMACSLVVRLPVACECGASWAQGAPQEALPVPDGPVHVPGIADPPGRMPDLEGRMISSTIYLDPTQHARMKELSRLTRRPMSQFIREAIDAVTAKYAEG